MTTQEMFDCSLEEMGLNARTRGALKKLEVTTLDGLEKALLSDQGLPGLGPKAAEDIDRALDALDADAAANRRRTEAVAAIFRAHDELANLLMLMTDMAIDLSAGKDCGLAKDRQLNGPTLRKETADMLRRTLRETYAALQVLAPELPDMAEYAGGDA
jgi:hypothetical protein